jgi:hypothetical protein
MKMYGIWTSDPSRGVQDRSKKNPSLVQALGSQAINWAINEQYWSTPWSVVARRTDRRTDKVRTIAYFSKIKNTLKKYYHKMQKIIHYNGILKNIINVIKIFIFFFCPIALKCSLKWGKTYSFIQNIKNQDSGKGYVVIFLTLSFLGALNGIIFYFLVDGNE